MSNDVIFNTEFNAETELKKYQNELHIRVHRKSKRQCITLIEGLDKLNLSSKLPIDQILENLAKKLRKEFNCGVTIKKPDNTLQLMGDHGETVKQYLVKNGVIEEDQVIIHGC